MKRRTRSGDHVILIPGGGIGCAHCGVAQEVPYPIAIPVFVGMEKAFRKMHTRCRKGPGGEARFTYANAREWRESWDTGISSLTIYQVFAGGPLPRGGPGVPHDPADFGRCYRLLKVAPEWRARLSEVAVRYPEWTALLARWEELERLYEEELPTGSCPKLYVLLRELNGEGR